MRALIFANGEAPPPGLVAALAAGDPLIVAADGGVRHAFACGLEPDAVVGDLDSVEEDPALRRRIPLERLHRVARLDTTDLEKAVLFAIERGCTEIDIVGAAGGRSDHALGNLSVLTRHRASASLRMHDELFDIRPVDGSISVEGPPGTVVSLMAIGVCTGVTTRGLRWPLQDFTLPFGPRGIHNEIAESPATVSVTTGDLLVFIGRWVEKHQ